MDTFIGEKNKRQRKDMVRNPSSSLSQDYRRDYAVLTRVAFHITVKNSEGSEILTYLQASKLLSQSFMDTGRGHRLETKNSVNSLL